MSVKSAIVANKKWVMLGAAILIGLEAGLRAFGIEAGFLKSIALLLMGGSDVVAP